MYYQQSVALRFLIKRKWIRSEFVAVPDGVKLSQLTIVGWKSAQAARSEKIQFDVNSSECTHVKSRRMEIALLSANMPVVK